MINKAVITAAGRGTRFLPVVKSYPKELIPILDKPNIQIIIEEIIAAGIKNICIVHRPEENAIKNFFTPDKQLEDYLTKNNKMEFLSSLQRIWAEAKLEFVPQTDDLPYGNASPALAAKDFIGTDDFAYVLGDDLIIENIPGQYLKQMITTFDQYHTDAVVSTQEMPTIEMKRYGAIVPHIEPKVPRQISTLLEKTDPPPSNFAVVGRYIASNKIMAIIKDQDLSKDNELWWADALNTLAKTGVVVDEPITNGVWMTTGDPIRWLKANIVFALHQPQYKDDLQEFIKTL
ncbi:MAG: sugar phosphate nucleotidyltransferase [Candidatus Shapirobacteria bacterium]|nr:sugar phosphate nucleotidyltransferase [Candidatus Shapirobacteria bacterium]